MGREGGGGSGGAGRCEYGVWLRARLREFAQHRVRTALVRLHDGRRRLVPARGHGGGGLESNSTCSGGVVRHPGQGFSELCGRKLGAARIRRIACARWTCVANDRGGPSVV